MGNISAIDYTIIFVYLVGILFIGIWVVRKQKMTSSSYFLAGRSLNWAMVGAALFASNISTIHMVGLASAGYSDGLVQGNFEWMAAFILILLGLIFAPFYFNNGISTLPEFLEKRYDGRSRTLLAILALAGALFMHIGISLYAGAVVFEKFFNINRWYSLFLIAGFTSVYTVLGGLKSVVVTETVQTVILIIGASLMTILAIMALPEHGVTNLQELKAALKPDQLSLIRSAESSPKLPWYAILLGYPVLGIWYWCADQTIVQRVLGAKTLRDAQVGPIFAGFIKILPVFIMVLPGILAYVLYNNVVNDPNDALPVLIINLLPVGLKGIMAAALLAALMSTIAAALNSSATLVSVDIVKRTNPGVSDKKQVRVGRWTAVLVMIMAILWSPMIEKFTSIFDAINEILARLSPPIACVFLLGVMWKRGTKEASAFTILFGFILGILVFILDFTGERIITHVWGIPYMLQSWWLFVICCVVFVVVSLFTPKPLPHQLDNLTLDRPMAFITKGKVSGIGDPRVLAGLLVLVMAVLYYVFK